MRQIRYVYQVCFRFFLCMTSHQRATHSQSVILFPPNTCIMRSIQISSFDLVNILMLFYLLSAMFSDGVYSFHSISFHWMLSIFHYRCANRNCRRAPCYGYKLYRYDSNLFICSQNFAVWFCLYHVLKYAIEWLVDMTLSKTKNCKIMWEYRLKSLALSLPAYALEKKSDYSAFVVSSCFNFFPLNILMHVQSPILLLKWLLPTWNRKHSGMLTYIYNLRNSWSLSERSIKMVKKSHLDSSTTFFLR